MGFLSGSPAWQLISQSDLMTWFILLSLFGLSIFCCWIIICKFMALKKEKQQMKLLITNLKEAKTFDSLVSAGEKFKECAGGRFLIQSVGDFKKLIKEDNSNLSVRNIEQLRVVVDQIFEHVMAQEELYLPVLGTSAAVSPLIGLFGTVWGLVHAFINISREKTADIAVIAPGIAEALLTTLAGLLVAIPALIFFHYFSNEVRKIEQQLLGVSDQFVTIVKQTFV